MNRTLGKMSIDEIKESIFLIKEVINNRLFVYDKTIFKNRLLKLKEVLKERKNDKIS